MTDEKHPDPTKTGTIAQKIVALLQGESSETRRRAIQATMMLLGEQPLDESQSGSAAGTQNPERPEVNSMHALFENDQKLKPSGNAYLCAAYHFSLYGNAPFSLDELRGIAGEAGVVIPDRLDMTLKQAGKGGKKFFQSAGRDSHRPTAAAGVFFNKKWGVKPGKNSKIAAGGKS